MDYSKIKKVIEYKKMTIREVCRLSGITEPGFYKMINHESMKVEVLENIAKSLEVNISSFFDKEGELLNLVSEPGSVYNLKKCKKCEEKEETIVNLNRHINDLHKKMNDCLKELEKRKAG